MHHTQKAHVAVLAANLIFAVNFSLVKIITPSLIGSFGLNVVRIVVSVALFWLFYLLKPSFAGIRKEHRGRFIICGISGVAINQMLFIKGLSLTTPIHAALLMLASPIFVSIIAAWLLPEKLTWQKIIGLLIGVSGAAVLISVKENSVTGTNILLGDFLILINAISYAFFMVLVKPLMHEYKPVHVLRWVFTIGAVFIVPVGWMQFVNADWQAFTLPDWVSLAFIVVGATFFAYLFNIYGIRHIGASATGAYIYTQPVFATVIAILFFNEIIDWHQGVAALLIFSGVYLVNQKRKEINV